MNQPRAYPWHTTTPFERVTQLLSGWVSDRTLTADVIAAFASACSALFGERAAETFIARAVNCLAIPLHRSGIPDNVHSHGLRMRIWRTRGPFVSTPKRVPEGHGNPLRVGLVAELTYSGNLLEKMCLDFPPEHELFVFRTRAGESMCPIDRSRVRGEDVPVAHIGHPVTTREMQDERYERFVRKLAERINSAQLDVLLYSGFINQELQDVVSLVDTPCIVAGLQGLKPTFHPKVDFCVTGQFGRAFPLMGNLLYSVFTRRPLPAERVYSCLQPFPDWEVNASDNPAWEDREKVMLFHGGMGKLQSESFRRLIVRILRNDRDVQFRFLAVGSHVGEVLDDFARQGVAQQVEYLGGVDKGLQACGQFQQRITEFLRRGRLSVNPFPHGGGTSLIEAWAAGTPTVQLGMTPPHGPLFSSTEMWTAVPGLYVPLTTAMTMEEYGNYCMKCLNDKEFSEQVITQQYDILARVVCARTWWNSILDSYRQWLTGTGWAQGDPPAGGRLP